MLVRFLLLCLALSAGFQAEPARAAEPLIYVEFQPLSDRIKPGTFQASTRKIWRVGRRYLRFQEAPHPEAKVHGLIISDAPNSYMINLYTRTGRHIVDPGPSIDVILPVFPEIRHKRLRELEMGHEFEFFDAEKPSVRRGVTVDGVKSDRYVVRLDGYEVTLHARAGTRTPTSISLKHKNYQAAVKYLKHKVGGTVDYSLFKVPEGIKLVRVK